MGDALGTFFEARVCERNHAPSLENGGVTRSAMALCRLCLSLIHIFSHGVRGSEGPQDRIILFLRGGLKKAQKMFDLLHRTHTRQYSEHTRPVQSVLQALIMGQSLAKGGKGSIQQLAAGKGLHHRNAHALSLIHISAALVMMALRMPASDSLWYLMHEMDDELLGAFFFWGGFAVIGYLARMLRREVAKAQPTQPVSGGNMEQTQSMPVYRYPQPICSPQEETTEQQ